MASTDSDDQSSKARTKPMTGFESIRPDQGMAPFAETAPPGLRVPGTETPSPTHQATGDTAAPTQHRATGPVTAPVAAVGSSFEICGYKCFKMLGRGGFGKVYLGEAPGGVPC